MKVFVFPDKTYEELGTKRWEVEWYTVKASALNAMAKRKAECVDSAYGCALVIQQVVDWYVEEDRVAEWANVGEPISVP